MILEFGLDVFIYLMANFIVFGSALGVLLGRYVIIRELKQYGIFYDDIVEWRLK